MQRDQIKDLISILLLILFSFQPIPTIAQASKNRVAGRSSNRNNDSKRTDKRSGCAGGWSGLVTYSKTLKDSLSSDEPGIRKSIDRIKHVTSRNYLYNGRLFIDGTDPKSPVVNSKVKFSDIDRQWGEERVFDTCNSRENGHWFIIEGKDDRDSTAQSEGSARSFNLSVDEMNGTYSFNFELPDAAGEYNRVQDVKRSGHCQAKNNEPYFKADKEAIKVKGESFSTYSEKIDPNNPDQLSGTKHWGDDGTGAIRSFVYTVSWRFTRCPEKVLITDLRFEHPSFPDYDKWVEIVEQKGTVDGNLVKIKAKVANLSAEPKFVEVYFKETYKGDKWNGSMPDRPLNDSTVSLRLDAGEEREVETLWDSSGYAWFDDGRPRNLQRIKTEVWENYKLKDEMTKNLKLAPKPLVIVPGIWTSASSIIPIYQNLLTLSHSYDWKAYIFDREANGQARSVFDKADALARFIRKAQVESNAWHIDILGHSTGGLVARLYVHKFVGESPDGRPQVKNLMLLGTPNLGVPCSSLLNNSIDGFGDMRESAKELIPEEMNRFNQFVMKRNGAKFSALIGNSMPLLCTTPEWNDGFVSVESAKYGISDFAISKDNHTDLTDARNFGTFIKPHLVTGPRGTYPLPVISEPGGNDGRTSSN